MSGSGGVRRPKVVAFDIIETVFSIDPLDGRLVDLGLPPGLGRRLYAEGLRDAMALAVVGGFAPFLDHMKGALAGLMAEHGLPRSDAEVTGALGIMRELPPHPDAREAFETLREAGIRVFALSNGAETSTRALLDRAGMSGLADEVLSVEAVQLAKPHSAVYRYAVETADVAPAEMMLVACHPWDVNGAKAAELLGGYVSRGKPYPPTMTAPDITGEQLLDVAWAIAKLPA